MAEVLFNYKGIETIIQCNINDKFKDIISKFFVKNQNNKNFFYNDDEINKELEFYKQANENDNKRKKMNILVFDKDENNDMDGKIIKSKEVICPECKEYILISIKDYKINLTQCKNNHIKKNILLETFERFNLKKRIFKICSQCSKNIENEDIIKCKDCKKIYCQSCSKNDIHIKNDDNKKEKINVKCNEHKSIKEYFCLECSKKVCYDCYIKKKNL